MAGGDRGRRTIGMTESICPVCLKVIPAEKTVREEGIYLQKTCEEHGSFEALIWEGTPESYEAWGREIQPADCVPDTKKADKGCPYDCGLCEAHERRGCCVLLEVTSRCNLNCPVCFAEAGGAGSRDVPVEELKRRMEDLMSHGGPFNLQISGGEPTVREDLPEIIRMGRELGFTFFQLNTNGIRLAQEAGYAGKLKKAGLSCVFLQFDGVEDRVYEVLRGRSLWAQKQAAIDACEQAGLGVVLVPVVAPGVNEDQVGAILSYAMSRMPTVRGVHFQPVSYFGRCLEAQGNYRITIPKLLRLIEEQTNGQMRAPHFIGGNATNPYCTFQANYLRQEDGSMEPMHHGTARAYATSEQAREFVARQWSGPEPSGACCCDGEAEEALSGEECCCCGETEGAPSGGGCCVETGAASSGEGSCCCVETEGTPSGEESCCCGEDTAQLQLDTSSLDEFLIWRHNNTFAVSGMLFQDAGNLDLQRLRRCYILEADSRYGMVPFCAYNLTDREGRSLYR